MNNLANNPINYRPAMWLALAAALSALAAGVSFFFDPSHSAAPGSATYWRILAENHWGRTAFVASFALAGLFSMGTLPSLRQLLQVQPGGWLDWLSQLGWLGFAVNAISYVRLLGGESRRAAAYVAHEPATQQAIASFSLVLDTQGWLTFGAVGIFIIAFNLAAWTRRAWPRWLVGWGVLLGAIYVCACLALAMGRSDWVAPLVGVGAIGLGPIWWLGIAWQFNRQSA